jgi:serine/threonine protein kinase
MSDKKFERFGKYLILDHLVDGGMAKICRARFLGEQANKIVAIKMVQPQFSKDAQFVQMFEDELRVTFGLLHPNIAQMYDYGKVNDQLYTAMEYVDGKNLKEYNDRLKDKKYVFPVEICTYIISQVCQGLHYAHTFTDKLSGNKLNIVHRDISPHNIMLTYDGAVKVIDFGIAKANTNSEATQAGTIKGKLSYLAPEYLEGLELDHRYDQFAVGITLWELLCGRKLFQAANDLAVLKQIQACKIPVPSTINPNVPKELDQIVMKSLSKDRSMRYDDMDKFNRALVKFLYSQYPDFNSTDLSFFAKELFKEEIKIDREKFVSYGKIDIKPYIEEIKNEMKAKPEAVASGGGGSPSLQASSSFSSLELNFDKTQFGSIGLDNKKEETKKKIANAQATRTFKNPMTANGGTGARKIQQQKEKTSTGIKSIKQDEPSSNTTVIIFIIAASVAAVAYFNPLLVKEYTGIDIASLMGEKSEEPNRTISSAKNSKVVPVEVEQGTIGFVGLDPNMEIYVDNVAKPNTGLGIKVDLDKSLKIVIKKEGYKSFTQENVLLTKDNTLLNITIPELEKERIGQISVRGNFKSTDKIIFQVSGETKEMMSNQLVDYRIPAGSYDVIIEDTETGAKFSETVTIEEGMRTYLDHPSSKVPLE